MARLGKGDFIKSIGLMKFVFYRVKTVDKRFGLCYNTNKFGGSYENI